MLKTQNIVASSTTLKNVLEKLDNLAKDAILFVIDSNKKLIGSITDGDIRRGLIKGLSIEESLPRFMNPKPHFLYEEDISARDIIKLRKMDLKIIPIVNKQLEVVRIINFRETKALIPADALIMAGGLGTRLQPLTNDTPKPLLMVGEKPIIQYGIDHLAKYGIDNINISVNYLREKIINYFKANQTSSLNINFVIEDKPLGTIGAITLIEQFTNDTILLMNSDILTNMDLEDFYIDFLDRKADMAVATIPYKVKVPYAIVETENGSIKSFKEKPSYTYHSNGGIYLIKRDLVQKIPKSTFYNATDLMELVLKQGGKIISCPVRNYWLDIGKHADFEKAQEDVKHLNL